MKQFILKCPIVSRRWFLNGVAGIFAAPCISTSIKATPHRMFSVTSGDVTENSAVIWGHTDRTAKMIVEWATTDKFQDIRRIPSIPVTKHSGYTGQVVINNLPAATTIFYRVRFEPFNRLPYGKIAFGRFRTPGPGKDVSFVFGGDQCGAGWGINPEWGGLRLFETMRQTYPDFLIHLGDRIYADRPINDIVHFGNGKRWKNIVTPSMVKVAETIAEFRGNYSYNFLDENYRRFSAEVPMIATWDDHEVTNNWWPGRKLSRRVMQRKGYAEQSVDRLAARGRQAFFEFTPMRRNGNKIYRKISYGPLADIILLDSRSYRSANNRNRLEALDNRSALLGSEQVTWLKDTLTRSRATWKFIGNPLPISHVRQKILSRYDKFANNNHSLPLGRELELADILSHIQNHNILNVVWLAADVHYCAAHFFDPSHAAFQSFTPFWEFIAGPFHARPGRVRNLDHTFGPNRRYRSPISKNNNPPPSEGYLYFGHAKIDSKTSTLTVTFRDLKNNVLYTQAVKPTI